MAIDWSKAPANAEAAWTGTSHLFHAWYRRDLYGRVFQICPSAGIEDWTSMGGRTDFPVGSVLRPVEKLGATVQQAEGWNGEGLPPVGCSLEYLSNKGWKKAECVAHKDGYALLWVNVGNFFPMSENDREKFRPIRTAEQIAAAEREFAAVQMCIDAGSPDCTYSQLKTAYQLYDAGYRKQDKPCGS